MTTRRSDASVPSSPHTRFSIFQRLLEIVTRYHILFGAIVSALSAISMVGDPKRLYQLIYLVGTFVVGLFFHLYYQRRRVRHTNPINSLTEGNDVTSKTTKEDGKQRLKNIWDTNQKSKYVTEEKVYQDKPFGSKYYYAHNNPNATGGYKDGLKMEDYRMNGPRLLSRNGLTVQEEEEYIAETVDKEDITIDEKSSASKSSKLSEKITIQDADVKIITKYLWDDPGDSNGIATIRIDVLPGNRIGEYIEWKDVTIDNVNATLAGEGMLVKVSTKDHGKFHLKIAKLYGDAADVKAIIKPKRLLIKIQKKKNAFLSMTKTKENNLDAWPHPHRKI